LVTTGSADNAFQVKDTIGNSAIAMYGNGNATFTGTIDSANVSFNLEADDDTKYTTTTDSEGIETRVYNGAVLDVKTELQALRARATQQDETIKLMTTALKTLGVDVSSFPIDSTT
jgi:hypothetical protein